MVVAFLRLMCRLLVSVHDLIGCAFHLHPTGVQPQHTIATGADLRQVVRDKNDCAALFAELVDPCEAFLLKGQIADRQHFVDKKDTRVEMRRYPEAQTQLHPAGIGPHRLVDMCGQPGEFRDRVEPLCNFAPQQPAEDAPDEDVVTPRQIGVHSCVKIEQPLDRRGRGDRTAVGSHDPAEQAQQRRFSRTIASDHAEHLTRRNRKAHIVQRFPTLTFVAAEPPGYPSAEGGRRIRVAVAKSLGDPTGAK